SCRARGRQAATEARSPQDRLAYLTAATPEQVVGVERSAARAEKRALHDVEDRDEGEDGGAQDRVDQRQQRRREVDEWPRQVAAGDALHDARVRVVSQQPPAA